MEAQIGVTNNGNAYIVCVVDNCETEVLYKLEQVQVTLKQ